MPALGSVPCSLPPGRPFGMVKSSRILQFIFVFATAVSAIGRKTPTVHGIDASKLRHESILLQNSLGNIPPEPPSCALVFFGIVKQFDDVVLPSIRRYLTGTNPRCDTYAHTYDVQSVNNTLNGEIGAKISVAEVRQVDFHCCKCASH